MGYSDRNTIDTSKKIISLSEKRDELKNPEVKQLEDLKRLESLYIEIQKINNDDARRVATLACRSAQTFVSKSVLA